jgi:hypothetical protein
MRAWSQLLVCGLRLHRWSDRAVVVSFSRRRAADVRSILAVGAGLPATAAPGGALVLAAMRQLAPELLITAKTQRRASEEVPRTEIGAELAVRDVSNARTRMKNAAFPVIRTLEELDRTASSIVGPTLDYLASLEWVTAPENLCLVGPAGAGNLCFFFIPARAASTAAR